MIDISKVSARIYNKGEVIKDNNDNITDPKNTPTTIIKNVAIVSKEKRKKFFNVFSIFYKLFNNSIFFLIIQFFHQSALRTRIRDS